jgi:hypothetical protein
MSNFLIKLALLILIISICYRVFAPHYNVKNLNKESHQSFILPNVFPDEDFKSLQNFAKNINFELTIKADSTIEDNYGSSEIEKNGKCPHRIQHPNINKTRCIVPARIDVAKHYMMTGGHNSKKEYLDTMASRIIVFQSFLHQRKNETNLPEIVKLFENDSYKSKALVICEGRPVLDPIQVSFLMNIPGQEVAMHRDVPWFLGMDRFNLPSWLLIVMEQSGLYEQYRIPQIQGVSYLHDWKDYDEAHGGFYFYPEGLTGKKVVVPAVPNQALILDGSKVPHATETFRPNKKVQVKIDKNEQYLLKYNGNNWDMYMKSNMTKIANYENDDIRISFVWRQRCFRNEEEKENYHKKIDETILDTKNIINDLIANLIKLGKIKEKPISEIDTIETLLKHYVEYPFPDSVFPYNYCVAAEKFLPAFIKPLFDLFCS